MEQIWKEMFQAAKAVQNGRQIAPMSRFSTN